MTFLLVAADDDATDAYVGGRPFADAALHWPCCRTCQSPMQFIAHLPLSASMEAAPHGDLSLLLFQCQAQPGMCEEWSAVGGGNAAILSTRARAHPLDAPPGETTLPQVSHLRFVAYDEPADPDQAQDLYQDVYSAPDSQVVGKAGGQALWIQYDETPTCSCGTRMTFVAQLEERGSRGLNFGGGGSAYAFACAGCKAEARFLWQC